ncbi:MAG: transporter substrate-binding domain-containing protein, partial [Chloroflexi bacterium]
MKRLPIVLATVAMTLAACGGSSAGPAASSSGPAKVASIAAEVPSSVPTPIQIATDATYSPDEYIDPTTGDIVGWDIDLGKAICKVMGVACTFNNVTFDSIIPQLTATNPRYVLGISSFTPTAEREAKGIDFVSYYKAGEGWVVAASSSITVNSA